MSGAHGDDRFRYGILVAATLLASVAGYVGYGLYPRLGLPPVAGATMLLLAAAAGFAAFSSPCSFPLLATLLARRTTSDSPRAMRLRRALSSAAALSTGAVTFVVTVGVVFALGGRSRHLDLHLRTPHPRRRRRRPGHARAAPGRPTAAEPAPVRTGRARHPEAPGAPATPASHRGHGAVRVRRPRGRIRVNRADHGRSGRTRPDRRRVHRCADRVRGHRRRARLGCCSPQCSASPPHGSTSPPGSRPGL